MTKRRHLKALFDKAVDSGEKISTAIPFDYSETFVRFSFSRCLTRKDVCLRNVTQSENLIKSLYRTLGNLENYTWQQALALKREDGISIEKKSDPMHKILQAEMPDTSTFGHFRVDSNEKKIFRVFGGRTKDLFCILYFDVDGKMQH